MRKIELPYSRPSGGLYDAEKLPNHLKFTNLEKVPLDGASLDADLNKAFDSLNQLQASIDGIQAGLIDGSGIPSNANKLVTTNGNSTLNWVTVSSVNITPKGIAGGSIADNTIASGHLAAACVTNEKIKDNDIGWSKLSAATGNQGIERSKAGDVLFVGGSGKVDAVGHDSESGSPLLYNGVGVSPVFGQMSGAFLKARTVDTTTLKSSTSGILCTQPAESANVAPITSMLSTTTPNLPLVSNTSGIGVGYEFAQLTSAAYSNSSVGTSALASGCVTTAILANGCVTTDKLGSNSVGGAHIIDNSVTPQKIGGTLSAVNVIAGFVFWDDNRDVLASHNAVMYNDGKSAKLVNLVYGKFIWIAGIAFAGRLTSRVWPPSCQTGYSANGTANIDDAGYAVGRGGVIFFGF